MQPPQTIIHLLRKQLLMFIIMFISEEPALHVPIAPCSSQMSPEDTYKPIRIYMGGLILGVNTLYIHTLPLLYSSR